MRGCVCVFVFYCSCALACARVRVSIRAHVCRRVFFVCVHTYICTHKYTLHISNTGQHVQAHTHLPRTHKHTHKHTRACACTHVHTRFQISTTIYSSPLSLSLSLSLTHTHASLYLVMCDMFITFEVLFLFCSLALSLCYSLVLSPSCSRSLVLSLPRSLAFLSLVLSPVCSHSLVLSLPRSLTLLHFRSQIPSPSPFRSIALFLSRSLVLSLSCSCVLSLFRSFTLSFFRSLTNEGTGTRPDYLVNHANKKLEGPFGEKKCTEIEK